MGADHLAPELALANEALPDGPRGSSQVGSVFLLSFVDALMSCERSHPSRSARWTNEVKAEWDLSTAAGRRGMLRCYGYGVPDLARALWSARDSLTLVVQDQLQPFCEVRSDIKTGEMHIHALPWPVDQLRALGETVVRLRVTLSYFVEPNPGRRGMRSRHVYPSHRLVFDVRRPAESRHSDVWRGTAADLADRGHIAILPRSGWWRTREAQRAWSRRARDALVVSIETPKSEVDVYTPVATAVGVGVGVTV